MLNCETAVKRQFNLAPVCMSCRISFNFIAASDATFETAIPLTSLWEPCEASQKKNSVHPFYKSD